MEIHLHNISIFSSSFLHIFFKGNNIEQVFRQLLTKYPVKGEFEKTSEYEKKVSSITYNDIYAFKIDYDNTLDFEYDPDNELLIIDLKTTQITNPNSSSGSPKEPGQLFREDIIAIKTVGDKVSSYIGTNAFGAKKVIKKNTGVIYGLIPKEKIDWISINMKPAEAKKYKKTLKVLLICKTYTPDKLYPPAFTGAYYFSPTFSEPIEMNYVAKIINVEILELRIYDYNTGKILGKREFY
jgi:hypothetical protein